ncbi:unnamed protein product [Scytosiphon promiscuus]
MKRVVFSLGTRVPNGAFIFGSPGISRTTTPGIDKTHVWQARAAFCLPLISSRIPPASSVVSRAVIVVAMFTGLRKVRHRLHHTYPRPPRNFQNVSVNMPSSNFSVALCTCDRGGSMYVTRKKGTISAGLDPRRKPGGRFTLCKLFIGTFRTCWDIECMMKLKLRGLDSPDRTVQEGGCPPASHVSPLSRLYEVHDTRHTTFLNFRRGFRLHPANLIPSSRFSPCFAVLQTSVGSAVNSSRNRSLYVSIILLLLRCGNTKLSTFVRAQAIGNLHVPKTPLALIIFF